MLNWIYIDDDTHALKYGARKDTVSHIIGPWGWSEDEVYLTLRESHAAFIARKEDNGSEELWRLYWDPDQQMLAGGGTETCKPARLRRRPLLGVESRYVRDDEKH